jgi:hypothetical protein
VADPADITLPKPRVGRSSRPGATRRHRRICAKSAVAAAERKRWRRTLDGNAFSEVALTAKVRTLVYVVAGPACPNGISLWTRAMLARPGLGPKCVPVVGALANQYELAR